MMRLVSVRDARSIGASVREHLEGGGVICYPTETVYGLGTVLQPEAIERLASMKNRPHGHTFLILVSNLGMLESIGLRLTAGAMELADRFWPGAMTLVLPEGGSGLPDGIVSESGGVAVRWSGHAALNQLIREIGRPITSTSANKSGESVVRSSEKAAVVFRDEVESGVLMLLEGQAGGSAPSTVVDCMRDPPVIVREGEITGKEVEQVLGQRS